MFEGIDFSKIEDEKVGGPLPAGHYTAKIEKIEKKDSKKNPNNKYLNVQYKVTGMEKRNGAVFFDIVNIINANETAQNIGLQRYKSMLTACGYSVEQMKGVTPEQIIGKVVSCVLAVEKDNDGVERNRVKAVMQAKELPKEAKKENVPDWM